MKKSITICTAVGLMVFATSVAYAVLPSDNFDNNSIDTTLWTLYEDDHSKAWLDETSERLEFRSTADANDEAALYISNDWGLSTADNFSFKADFHNSFTSGGLHTWASVMLGLGKGSELATIKGNNAIVDAAWDRGDEGHEGPYIRFGYSYTIDGNESSSRETRESSDGTLYISYDAGADELYLSYAGYWGTNPSVTIPGVLKGEWDADVVVPFIGGSVENVALNSGDAYLDNFVVDSGIPEPATIALLGLGSLLLSRNRRFNKK